MSQPVTYIGKKRVGAVIASERPRVVQSEVLQAICYDSLNLVWPSALNGIWLRIYENI